MLNSFSRWLRRRQSERTRRAGRRPALLLEHLETRVTPAVSNTFANDNWVLLNDSDSSGTLSFGDELRNDNDTINPGGVIAFYGLNGFGTVTSSAQPGVTLTPNPAFDSIADAITGTVTGGTVRILQGTYTELVTVNKTVSLIGAQAGVDARTRAGGATTETILNNPGGSLSIQANNVAVDGFTVQGTTGLPLGAGIFTSASFSGHQIRNNIIQDNSIGLYLNSSGATQSVVEFNLIRDNDNPGAAGGTGVYSDQGLSNVVLRFNNIAGSNPTAGINLANTTSTTMVTLFGNFFTEGNQLVLFNVDSSSVVSNHFSGSLPTGTTGTALFVGGGSDNLTVNANVFFNLGNRAVSVTDAGSGPNTNFTFTGNVLVQNVNLYASGRSVIDLNGVGGTSRIQGNFLSLSGSTNATVAFAHGIEVRGASTGTVNIDSNTFLGGNADVANGVNDSAGVVLRATLPATAVVNVTNNDVSGFVNGVLVEALPLGADVNVNFNDLSGNSVDAVVNLGSTEVDASFNFYGVTGAAEVAALVSGNVDFTPWLGIGTDQSGAPGFQANLSLLFVGSGGLQTGATGRVQEALNLTANSTVVVQAGTFNESVTVGSGDTLAGVGTITGNVTVNSGGAVAPGQLGLAGSLGTGGLQLAPGAVVVVDVNSASAGGSDRINVTGTVNLGGSTLVVNAGAAGAGTVIIISNDGTDPVIGTFANLPEGGIVTAADGSRFRISYQGGDGNDVTLTAIDDDGNGGGNGGDDDDDDDDGDDDGDDDDDDDGDDDDDDDDGDDDDDDDGDDGRDADDDGIFAVAAGAGGGARVTVFNADGSIRFSFSAFAGFNGGLTVATGDVNDDGTDDIIVGVGTAHSGGHVKVFDGETGALIRSFFSFEGFGGGVNVASGDIDDDGTDDIIVSAGTAHNGGHVKVFDGETGALLRSFLAFPGFSGGVAVASGDINDDGTDDIIVGVSSGSLNQQVAVFSGEDNSLLRRFSPFEGFAGAVYVASGDVDDDGTDDIIVGAANAPGGHVKVFSGENNVLLMSFFAFDQSVNGVRVGAVDIDDDGDAEILAGAAAGSGPLVRIFDGPALQQVDSFFAFEGSFTGGVFVGGDDD